MPDEKEIEYRFRVDAGLYFSIRASSKEAAEKIAAEVAEAALDGLRLWGHSDPPCEGRAKGFQVYSNDDAKATIEDEEEVT